MRKRNKVKQLSGNKSYAKALRRNMITSLVLYEKLKTTKVKAKILERDFNKTISLVKKKDSFQSRRELSRLLYDENAVDKVLDVFLPRFKKIKSGYVKKYRLNNRKGDNAEMALLIVTGYEYQGIGSKMKDDARKDSDKDKEKDKKDRQKSKIDTSPVLRDSGDGSSKSQVDVRSSTQGKAKSRSGI